jgi:UDP-N-acetylmuramoyl-tripeptide--D-alanyl-D-alanine ligase
MATPIPQNEAAFSENELLQATGGESLVQGPLGLRVLGVATDTREVLRGKAFVALRGESFDGHEYLSQAVAAGARALLVDDARAPELVAEECGRRGLAVILVRDTLTALGDLSRVHRASWGGQLVAVVGSAGKTTTRSVITGLLNAARPGITHSTCGNLNNRVGVPMTLLGLRDSHRFAVVELGTNCPGEIAELGRISAPNVGVLTLIDLEHTEGLGDLDGVEEEEGALFFHLAPGGTAVGYGEDERVLRSLKRAEGRAQLTYGFREARDLQISGRDLLHDGASHLTLRRRSGELLSFQCPLLGQSGALAAAAGVTAVEALLGAPLSNAQCERGLLGTGQPGRSQLRVLPGERLVVDDTYNSNPASVAISVATGVELRRKSGGRLWLVLGEMLELGALSEESHRRMGELAAASGAEGVFFVQGDAKVSAAICKETLENTHYYESAAEVSADLAPRLGPSDVVVVKASRGVRAERVVEGLAAFFTHGPELISSPARKKEGGSSP